LSTIQLSSTKQGKEKALLHDYDENDTGTGRLLRGGGWAGKKGNERRKRGEGGGPTGLNKEKERSEDSNKGRKRREVQRPQVGYEGSASQKGYMTGESQETKNQQQTHPSRTRKCPKERTQRQSTGSEAKGRWYKKTTKERRSLEKGGNCIGTSLMTEKDENEGSLKRDLKKKKRP